MKTNRFFSLVRVSFLALMSSFKTPSRNRARSGKQGGFSGFGALVFMGAISLYISGVYSFMFAEQLKEYGHPELVIYLISVIAGFMSVLYTMFAAGGFIFGGKDSDLLLALPVSTFEIMLSKLLALYLENLFFVLVMMLPAGAAYMLSIQRFMPLFVITLIIASLLLALLTSLVSLVLGYVVTVCSTRFKKGGKIVSTILYFAFFAGVMLLSFRSNSIVTNFMASGTGLDAVSNPLMRVFAMFSLAALGSVSQLLLLAGLSVLPTLLIVYLFSRRYKAIITRMNSVSVSNNYRIGRVASSSQFMAIFKKEIGRYFGTTIYLFNTGFGLMMMLAGGVYALIKKNAVAGLMSTLAEATGGALGDPAPLLGAVLAFMVLMTCTTNVSLSLEGKTLWILKESPVPTTTVFLAKAWLNFSLIAVASIISIPMLAIAFSLSPVSALALILFCVSFGALVSLSGLIINLLFPKLDAYNDTVVVKQSAAVLVSMLFGMAAAVVCALPYALALSRVMSFNTYAFIISAVLALLCALCWSILSRWGVRRFMEL